MKLYLHLGYGMVGQDLSVYMKHSEELVLQIRLRNRTRWAEKLLEMARAEQWQKLHRLYS